MSDFREINPDEEREVPLDDDAELELPPATLDPQERVEYDTDTAAEEREAAVETGQIEP